jgi:K+ transporter
MRRKIKLTLKKSNKMKNRIIRAFAGTFILTSLLLAIYINQNWFWFTAFVGANLLQSSITKWCLMDDILTKLGVKD